MTIFHHLREFVEHLDRTGERVRVTRPVSTDPVEGVWEQVASHWSEPGIE